jgi:hypothetical protein
MNKIIIFLALFLIFNLDTLFSQGGFDASGEYYHTVRYNFYNDEYIYFDIYGNIELKENHSESNTEYYYVLILYEPIVFTKGFELDRTFIEVTVEEIQLLFVDNEVKNKIDLEWKGHIIDGILYFAENTIYHTPVIMIVDRVRING